MKAAYGKATPTSASFTPTDHSLVPYIACTVDILLNIYH